MGDWKGFGKAHTDTWFLHSCRLTFFAPPWKYQERLCCADGLAHFAAIPPTLKLAISHAARRPRALTAHLRTDVVVPPPGSCPSAAGMLYHRPCACCGEAAARAHQEWPPWSWTSLLMWQDPVPAGALLQEALAPTPNGCCVQRGMKNLIFHWKWLVDLSASSSDTDL